MDKTLFAKLMHEGTAYLVYDRIRLSGTDEEKYSEFYRLAESSYFHNLTKNLYALNSFFQDYKQILSDIPGILLKGASLLGSVYEDPGLRHLGDIDLLIHPEDFEKARKRLEEAGYQFNLSSEKTSDSKSIHSVMCRKKDAAPEHPFIHLHWHLINTVLPVWLCTPNFDMVQIWRDAEPINESKGLLRLSPVHQIIYYAYHHLKHSFDREIRLHDIDRTITHYAGKFDWTDLLAKVRSFNLERHLFFSFYAAKTALHSQIPDNILATLKPASFGVWENLVLKQITEGKKPSYAHVGVYLAMQKGILNKIRFLILSVFPAADAKPSFGYFLKRVGHAVKRTFQLLRSLSA